MKLLEIFQQISKLFDWYFQLQPIKRIQLNYILLLALVLTAAYYNDKQHRDNYKNVVNRMDVVNDARSKEQAGYTKNLEFFTEKFNHLLEISYQEKPKDKIEDTQ
jgi:hypothetical protein